MQAASLHTAAAPEAQINGAAEVELQHALRVFLSERTRLFRLAHRVTGDVCSAEDIVQEAWLRWQRTDRASIENPAAFLTTVTTHLAINSIQSAPYRHERPSESSSWTGATHAVHEAGDDLERTEVVEKTLGALMARLTGGELAAYVLRKAFDYPYRTIADLLRTSVPNARQLVRRGQVHLENDRKRPVSSEAHRKLVGAFATASRTGDFTHLEALLVQGSRTTCKVGASARGRDGRVATTSRPTRHSRRTPDHGTVPVPATAG